MFGVASVRTFNWFYPASVYLTLVLAALVINGIACFIWASLLLSVSLWHTSHYQAPGVWTSGVRDFEWYNHPSPAGTPDRSISRPGLLFRLIGVSRGAGTTYHAFVNPIAQLMFHHTPWRRVVGVEPIWLSLVRGTTAFVLLIALCAYASIQCISLPVHESNFALPVRDAGISLHRDVLEDTPVSLVRDTFPFQTI